MINKEIKVPDLELFERYAENQYSNEDLETIYKWFEKPGYDLIRRRVMNHYWIKIVNVYKVDKNIELKNLLDKVHHKLNLASNKSISEPPKVLPMNSTLMILYRIAAVIVIPLLIIAMSYFFNDERFFPSKQVLYSEISSPYGSRIKVDLSDGSEVWLNHGSKLKYPQKFKKNEREVFLNGEAYFQVNEDPSRPFIIRTSEPCVKVMGTNINLKDYSNDHSVEITLEEGSAILCKSLPDGSLLKIADLKPGQQAISSKISKKLTITEVETEKYTSWKDGKLMLLDDPMDIVIKKLERWYNVEIELEDQELREYRYTATFVDETIPQVLQLLSLATPIEFSITSRIKMPDNTFSKSKVIIKKKKN